MISIVLSKSVDKSNTKYYDVVIKWLNITTLTVGIDKRYTLYLQCSNKVILYYYFDLLIVTIPNNCYF